MDAFAESLGMDATALVVITLSAFLGAVVQGAIGFGLNLIVAPTIAAFVPEALPAAAIILALPMTLGSAAREFSHIERREWFTRQVLRSLLADTGALALGDLVDLRRPRPASEVG